MRADWSELRRWRVSVKSRDKYKCRRCGESNKRLLQCHHIKKFNEFKALRTVISNGITLCKKCHLQMKGCEELWEPMCQMLVGDKKILGKINKMLYKLRKEEEDDEEEI